MKVTYQKIDLIKPYLKNAKKHNKKQIEQVAASIKEFGFNQPIVVDKNNIVIVGHARLEASKLLELEKVPTLTVELSEEQAKSYRLADNKLNESDWDMGLVIDELKELSMSMVDLTGFDRDLTITSEERDDAIPEVPNKAKTSPGDVYEVGRHKVLCGDSTSEKDVEKLMGGGMAKIIFTSPPYNMGAGMYENYKDDLKKTEYIDFNLAVINNFKKHLQGFVFWNISYNKNSRDAFIEIIYKIIKETGLKFIELIVWDKGHGMPITSKEMITRQWEDILLAGYEDSVQKDLELFSIFKNTKAYFNKKTNRGITNYFRIGTNKTQLENHLACYPVALPVKGILLMTQEKEIVADPFLGSGSTLIAAEKTNRICYGMEMDPKYVDVIVQRWCEYTGIYKIKKNGKVMIWTQINKK